MRIVTKGSARNGSVTLPASSTFLVVTLVVGADVAPLRSELNTVSILFLSTTYYYNYS